MREGLTVADAHAHTNPVRGLGARTVARRFASSGGWFMAIVALPPWDYGLSGRTLEDHVKVAELVARECRAAREEGLEVACLSGFHPAIVDRLAERGVELHAIEELGRAVIDHVVKLCRQGVLDGIGEVGRQHYATRPERVIVAHSLMEYALNAARDEDLVVHLHLENAGLYTVVTVERLLRRTGVKAHRVLLHHSRGSTLAHAVGRGLMATVPGVEPALREAFAGLAPSFLVESDFIDDPKRPGVVTYPWNLRSVEERLVAAGIADPEHLQRVNVDNVVRVYGVRPP